MSGDGIGEHLVGDKAIGAADSRRQAHVTGQAAAGLLCCAGCGALPTAWARLSPERQRLPCCLARRYLP